MLAITGCVKTYWRNVHKQFLLRRDPERYAKTLDNVRLRACRQGVGACLSLSAVEVLKKLLQRTNTRRQAARDFCDEIGMGPGQAGRNIKPNDWFGPKTGGTVTSNVLPGSGDAGMCG